MHLDIKKAPSPFYIKDNGHKSLSVLIRMNKIQVSLINNFLSWLGLPNQMSLN